MLKTLGCLAGAMTLTSAMLGWIDRTPPTSLPQPSFDVALRLARSLVTRDVDIRRELWGRVEILAGPAKTASASLLTATASPAAYHFHVDLDGWPSRTRRWFHQEELAGHPRSVRIQVARRDESEAMSQAQWNSVRALVAALGGAVAAQGASLPVRLQTEWGQDYIVEPDRLQRTAPLQAHAN